MSDENQAPEGEQNALSTEEDARANDLTDAQAPATLDEIREVGQQVAEAQADGAELSTEGEGSSEPTVVIVGSEASLVQLQARLAELIAHRDRAKEPEMVVGEENPEFNKYRDCDRILERGTIVKIDGIPCRLLVETPVMSDAFRDEVVFVEHLAASGQGLAANARGLCNVYDPRGKVIGVNQEHGYNRLCAEIAKLEAEIADLQAPEADEAEKAE